jgi:high-affinity nickel-transport protein
MYPLGVLFGLGFDTATEIGLLGLSAAQASQGMHPISLLIFPTLFAAGMTLVDTTDGVLMVGAYGWAFAKPERKLWYNLTMTAASILVAAMIGSVEVLSLLASKLNLNGMFWRKVQGLNDDLASFGLFVIGLFALSWIVSAIAFNFKTASDLPATRRM